jgi:hypothetical protein
MPFILISAVHLTLFCLSCFFITCSLWTVFWLRKLVPQLRNQQTVLRSFGALSQPYRVLPGVPQGSVFGPLLFNILKITCVMLLN